jgi:hypothetical protein
MPLSGMISLGALVRTDVTEELSASIVTVTRISELGLWLMLLIDSYYPDDGGAKFIRNVGSYKSHTA